MNKELLRYGSIVCLLASLLLLGLSNNRMQKLVALQDNTITVQDDAIESQRMLIEELRAGEPCSPSKVRFERSHQ